MMKRLMFIVCLMAIPALCLAQNQPNQGKQEKESMFPPSSGQGKCPYLQEKGDQSMESAHGMMGKMRGKGMCPTDGDGMAGMGMGMMGKCAGMMDGACPCGGSIAASDKGGVIVLRGNNLYKYDKNLNLVKQAEIGSED